MITNRTRRSPLLLAVFVILAAGSGAEAEDSRADALAKQAQAEKPRPKITVSRETTFVTGPLREDGYVDYLAALNQAASEGVTPENNAAVLLWRALGPAEIPESSRDRFFKLLGIPPLPEEGDYFVACENFGPPLSPQAEDSKPEIVDQLTEAMRPWSGEELPAIAEWLKRNDKPLTLAVAATQRPRYFSPLVAADESTLLVEVPLPAVRKVREVARALCARAMLRANAGKVEEAWEDLLACHRLGHLMGQGPLLVQWLVGVAVNGIACVGEASLAHHANPSADQARRFLSDLDQLPPMAKLAHRLNVGERYVTLEAASIGAREGPHAFARLSGEPPNSAKQRTLLPSRSKYADADWDETLRVVNEYFDRAVEAASKPTHAERLAATAKLENDLNELVKEAKKSLPWIALSSYFGDSSRLRGRAIGQIFAVLMMPAVTATTQAEDRDAVFLSLSRTALALAAYRADQGAYPESLSQLSPKYLPEVPQDLFGDGPFRYERQGSGYLLYSVGINGKDDGGRDRPEEGSSESPPPDDLVIRASSQAR